MRDASFRQLLWMAEGKQRQTWEHTAAINLYQCLPHSKKKLTYDQFNPYAARYRAGGGKPWTPESNEQIVRMLCRARFQNN